MRLAHPTCPPCLRAEWVPALGAFYVIPLSPGAHRRHRGTILAEIPMVVSHSGLELFAFPFCARKRAGDVGAVYLQR